MKSGIFYSGLLLATLLGGCSKDTEQAASPDSTVATRSATEESLETRTPPHFTAPSLIAGEGRPFGVHMQERLLHNWAAGGKVRG